MSHTAIALNQAFNPAASVFVSANAGAGKTQLLTNRVLRLLLHGVSPSHILCLTFTNAAAAEMDTRILRQLGKWVMAEEPILKQALAELLGGAPNDAMMTRARSLFAHVVEAPEGVRIQTIHGFCQSLLRRFPIEANVSTHFTLMDGRTEQELLQEARTRLFNQANNGDPVLQAALRALAQTLSETAFQALLGEIVSHKRRFSSLFHQPGGVERAIHQLWRAVGVSPGTTEDELMAAHFAYDPATLTALRRIATQLLQGKPTDCKTGQALADWLAGGQAPHLLTAYGKAYINKDGSAKKPGSLFTQKCLADNALIETLLQEQERVLRFHEARKALDVGRNSEQALHLAEALLALYAAQKRARALMDYDDLILTACDVLEKPGIAPWILFKLDGGIDHILVDEAQDTSPEQWRIIDALTQDFFSGDSRKEIDRSLFVVGDEKQSIYSFQGAEPAALGEMKRYFSRRIEDAGKPLHHLALLHSYRSTPEILQAVDAVFTPEAARDGLSFDGAAFTHIATRSQPGLVEIWPLVRPLEESTLSHSTLLARQLAATIKGWLERGVMLEAKGRSIRAGDIMILVRHRNALVDKLVRALKRNGVPVAGIDRMALTDNLAVQDLLALGQCLLLPEDDLTLAALLKSPICGLDEEALFTLAWDRGEASLWARLQQFSSQPPFGDAYALLSGLRARADFLSPYELYAHALDTLGARRHITGRMGEEYNDSLDEFLNQALLYERAHMPSLQGFLHWLACSDSEIKRDMEHGKDEVRILTVHGAKGLQAPIVILPDTTQPPLLHDSILWHDALPLWPISSTRDDALCRRLRAQQRQAMLAEYRRLLYVALTRAEDRLYICGSTGKEAVQEQSWYQLVSSGLAGLAQPFAMGEEAGLRHGAAADTVAKPVFSEAATAEADAEQWGFLHQPAPLDPLPPRPLAPSHLPDDQPASASPLAESHVFQRGNFIHALLQHLAQAVPGMRAEVVANLSALYRRELPEPVLQQAVAEAGAILDTPEFSFLFSDDTLAEVPITGCVEVNGTVVTVSGQIDRLKVGHDQVWIVDFKSNRLPPLDSAGIPAGYIRQLRLYRLLLQRIYPQKQVHCALLWTAVPKLMRVDDALFG